MRRIDADKIKIHVIRSIRVTVSGIWRIRVQLLILNGDEDSLKYKRLAY